MEVKKMIEFLIKFRNEYKDIKNSPYIIYAEQMDNIISLLQSLSKYKELFEETKEYIERNWLNWQKEAIKVLEQKYFPQPVKKTITIEVEAKDEKSAKWAVDYITCDIKKNNWVEPSIKIKVNIKEADND